MLRKFIFAAMSLMVTGSTFAGLVADSGVVDDAYWGADDHGWGDRIGNSTFEIFNSRVELSDTQLKFSITTNFVNGSKPISLGARLGDMFFTFDGYTPNTDNPDGDKFRQDDMYTGTKWRYALQLQGIPVPGDLTTSGSVKLFELNTTNAATYENSVISSTEYWANNNLSGTVRDGQEVQVDTAGATEKTNGVSGGGWSRSGTTLTISLDVADMATTFTELAGGEQNGFSVAYHWAMTCGNDTVENAIIVPPGFTQVPEPSTAAIFGLGLLGLGIAGRRRKNKVA